MGGGGGGRNKTLKGGTRKGKFWEEFYKSKFQKTYQQEEELMDQVNREVYIQYITEEGVIKVPKRIKVDKARNEEGMVPEMIKLSGNV